MSDSEHKIDWDDLEQKALKLFEGFNKNAVNAYGDIYDNKMPRAEGALKALDTLTRLRAQRLAEEIEKGTKRIVQKGNVQDIPG